MLTLACELNHLRARQPEIAVTIDLGVPRPAFGNRFLRYAAEQGFFHVLSPNAQFIWKGKIYQNALEDLAVQLRSLDVVLAYQNADCIKAKIIDFHHATHEEILQTVEDLVLEAKTLRIERWLSADARQREYILQSLRGLLIESLDNISEHAYESGGFGGVYARIRSGSPEDADDFTQWREVRLNESRYCPTLNRNNFGRRPGWLELFVCDVGQGLLTTLPRFLPDAKSPLLSISNKLFKEPLSRHLERTKLGKTTLTGLQHVGSILQGGTDEPARGGFVRIFTGGEWVGEHFPWPPIELRVSHENYKRDPTANPLQGTLLHFCLEPPPDSVADRHGLYPNCFYVPSSDDLLKVRQTLGEQARPEPARAIDFIDLFIDSDLDADVLGRGKAVESWARSLRFNSVIIRPSRSIRKTDFIDQILAIGEYSVEPVKYLIYADAPENFAIDLANFLRAEKLRNLWPRSDLAVYVLSQDWCCAAFKINLDRQSFIVSAEAAQAFTRSLNEGPNAAVVAAILRQRDSELFWKEIDQDAYVDEPIIWTSNVAGTEPIKHEIDGYLDLPLALKKRSCYRAARRSMRRAVTSFARYATITSDILVRPVIHNNFIIYDGYQAATADGDREAVLASSIVMSGSTTARHNVRSDVKIVGIAHLLAHTQSSRQDRREGGFEVTAMLWLPKKAKPATQPRRKFERIANSSFVVRGGERAMPLPRFAPPTAKEKEYLHSYYGHSPDMAYNLWQRRGVLKMGHWVFGARHDLVSVNLLDTLQFDVADGGQVLAWLTDRLREIDEEAKKREVPWIIVYPRYLVTDLLMRMLQARMGDACPQTFPLQVVRDSSASPVMFSQVEQERIWQHLTRFFNSGGIVVHIDDTVITNRIVRAVRDLVQGLWSQLIATKRAQSKARLDYRTIVLLDRTGLPTQRALVERSVKSNPRLWRWDVPTLGHESACSLCAILNRCRELKSHLNSKLAERVEQWLSVWKPVSTAERRFDRGLRPTHVPQPDFTRFCIEQINANRPPIEHRVHHSISTSRAAIAVEICCSTTRKDYPLVRAKSGHFKDGSEMDLQTKVEILASHILLFLHDLTFVDRIDRLTVMLDLLWSAPVARQSTILAALTCLVEPKASEALWTHSCKLIEEKGIPNEDALIVAFALFLSSSGNLPTKQDHPDWTLFRMLIVPVEYTRGCISRIFQVLGWDAGGFHQGLLLDLLKTSPIQESNLEHIVLMLDELVSALEKLMPEMFVRTQLKPPEDAQKIRIAVQSIQELSRKALGDERFSVNESTALAILARYCETDEIYRHDLNKILSDVYGLLFVQPDSLQDRYKNALTIELKDDVIDEFLMASAIGKLLVNWKKSVSQEQRQEIAQRWNNGELIPDIKCVRGNWRKKETYVYTDALIQKCLIELLSNVMHRARKIACPWDGGADQADMWVRTSIAEDGGRVVVELVNGALIDEHTLNPDQTRASVHLGNIGGSIRYTHDHEAQTYATRIELPTIASLVLEQARWQSSGSS